MKKIVLLEKQNGNIEEISTILSAGGLVAFPTETVFGLACICNNQASINRLVEVKGRDKSKPFTLMCSSAEEAFRFMLADEKAKKIFRAFTPGEVTIIGQKSELVKEWMNFGSAQVGIRIPNDEFVLSVIRKVGFPLLVPSANKSGFPPCKTHLEVLKEFEGEIDAVVEGVISEGVPSTIVQVSDTIVLLREGRIPFNEILKVWEEE